MHNKGLPLRNAYHKQGLKLSVIITVCWNPNTVQHGLQHWSRTKFPRKRKPRESKPGTCAQGLTRFWVVQNYRYRAPHVRSPQSSQNTLVYPYRRSTHRPKRYSTKIQTEADPQMTRATIGDGDNIFVATTSARSWLDDIMQRTLSEGTCNGALREAVSAKNR